MYVTYHPAGSEEPTEFTFIPGKMNNFDAETIETATGWSWDEFLMNLQKGSVKARRTLLWILLRQQHRGLKLNDVRITPDEVKVEMDAGELSRLRDDIEQAPDQLGVDKDAVLAAIAIEIGKARPAPEGKAQLVIEGESTSSP